MTLKWMAVVAVALLSIPASAGETPAPKARAEQTPILKAQTDKVSYSIGVDVARNFQRQGIEVDVDLLMKGFKDALSGGKLLMTEDDVRATLNAYRTELMQKQAQAMTKAAEENKKVGEVFLAENNKKDGVVTLPSGLQYKVLKMGDGKKPTATDTVECNYRGTLIDGTEFDSSYRTGKPAAFQVSGVIRGWTEALQLMPVGSKWQLVIPPDLAYGAHGAGSQIGPNATLIFEVELLAIK